MPQPTACQTWAIVGFWTTKILTGNASWAPNLWSAVKRCGLCTGLRSSEADWLFFFSSHLQICSCSLSQLQNTSPYMSSGPPCEIPGRPCASSLPSYLPKCQHEGQMQTCANWSCPSPPWEYAAKTGSCWALIRPWNGNTASPASMAVIKYSMKCTLPEAKHVLSSNKTCKVPATGSSGLRPCVFKNSRKVFLVTFSSSWAHCLQKHVTW